MDTKRLVLLGVLAISAIILALVFFRSGGEEQIKQLPGDLTKEQKQAEEQPLQTKTITLFFLSEEDELLHPEERVILDNPSVAHLASQTIEELLKGSRNGSPPPFPDETKLRELFVTREGIAYVDFSGEISDGHISGSSSEMSTVFTVVNSLTYNFKSIKRVFILIEGIERETLAGHIDLSRPLLPRYDLVSN